MGSNPGQGEMVRWAFCFFLLLLYPPCVVSLTQSLSACGFMYNDCVRGSQGGSSNGKILAAPSLDAKDELCRKGKGMKKLNKFLF